MVLERVDVYLQYSKILGENMYWIYYGAIAFQDRVGRSHHALPWAHLNVDIPLNV